MAAGEWVNVAELAQVILSGVNAHFAAASVTLPGRQIIAPGEPRSEAWFCESVAVNLAGVGVGQSPGQGAGARQAGTGFSVGARHAVFVVQIVRCLPDQDADIPDAEKLTDAGLSLMKDAGLLSQALVEMCGPGGSLKRHGVATAGAVEMVGPEGALVAVEGSITVTLKKSSA